VLTNETIDLALVTVSSLQRDATKFLHGVLNTETHPSVLTADARRWIRDSGLCKWCPAFSAHVGEVGRYSNI
jgi:hypothetical protein